MCIFKSKPVSKKVEVVETVVRLTKVTTLSFFADKNINILYPTTSNNNKIDEESVYNVITTFKVESIRKYSDGSEATNLIYTNFKKQESAEQVFDFIVQNGGNTSGYNIVKEEKLPLK